MIVTLDGISHSHPQQNTGVHTTEESRMSEPSMSLHQVRFSRERFMRWNGAAFTWLEDCLGIP
jgi:hypothetical protein